MEKQAKRKRAIWISGGAILLVAVILLAFFLLFPAQKGYLVYEGNQKLIKKTQEQKAQFVIGCSEIPQSSFVCGEPGETAQQIGGCLFESMVTLSPSQEAEFQLAKEVSFSEDGKTAVITLCDANFSDGSSLTSQEVIDSYLGLNAPDSSYSEKEKMQTIQGMQEYQEGLASDISGIRVTGDTSLEITFTRASVYNLEALSLPIWKKAEGQTYPLGTGPYQIEKFQESQQVILSENQYAQKNPYGYEKLLFVNLPLENLKERISEYSVDAVTINGIDGYELMKDAGYFDIYSFPSGNYSYLTFSSQSDDLLRRMVYAIFDQEQFIDSVRNLTDSGDEYLSAAGISGPMKSENAFWTLAKKENAKRLVNKFAKEREDKTLRFLCPDLTKARTYFKELSDQFSAYGLQLEGIYVDDFDQAIESGTEYDLAFYFGMDRSPEQVTEENLFADSEAYESFMADCLYKNCLDLYPRLEKKAAEDLWVLPVDAKKQYLAVSADCHNEEMIRQLMR